jgi:hypothetical protein
VLLTPGEVFLELGGVVLTGCVQQQRKGQEQGS